MAAPRKYPDELHEWAKRGSKYHLLVDAGGLPLNVADFGATGTTACWSSRSWIRCRRSGTGAAATRGAGRSSCTPTRATTSRGSAATCAAAGSPPIARIGRDSSARLGRHRWVVERTLGWLLSYTRLALRYDRTALTITALARLAITLICARRLPTN